MANLLLIYTHWCKVPLYPSSFPPPPLPPNWFCSLCPVRDSQGKKLMSGQRWAFSYELWRCCVRWAPDWGWPLIYPTVRWRAGLPSAARKGPLIHQLDVWSLFFGFGRWISAWLNAEAHPVGAWEEIILICRVLDIQITSKLDSPPFPHGKNMGNNSACCTDWSSPLCSVVSWELIVN